MEKMAVTSMSEQTCDQFWLGKRVLLTGHTGFKGSWLSLWLQSMGAKVCGVSLAPPTNPALFTLARVEEGMEHRIGDIRDLSRLTNLVSQFQPEIVIHMAAQPLVRRSYVDPVETYSTNVMGTVNVLEASRLVGSVKAIVNVTTDKCYENREWVWAYREDEAMGGYDPYSSSKGCAELVSSAYRRSFLKTTQIAMATARAGNVIGGGDWAADRLIPDVIRSLQRNEQIQIRNPRAVRPWQHVLEPLSGYLLLAERLYKDGQEYAEGWNFGPNECDCKSVEWILERICSYWSGAAGWNYQNSDEYHEAQTLKLDISKARQKLRWAPRWPLESSLRYVIEWYKNWLEGRDMRSVCLDQISTYRGIHEFK